MNKKINIGIAGLGFGKEFIQIYQRHPNVDKVAICARTPETLDQVGNEFHIEESLRFTDIDAMIACDALDAIHIVTPIHDHAPQTLKALNAGKHVACTVPMATTLEECQAIVEASQKNKTYYMMMETAVYTREIPLRTGTGKKRETRPHAVHPWFPYAEYGAGGLAPVLARTASLPLWDPCNCPLKLHTRQGY